MPEIVLIVNIHPEETPVTQHLAQRLQGVLPFREPLPPLRAYSDYSGAPKMAHLVKVVSVPFENTFHDFYGRFGAQFNSAKEIVKAYHNWEFNHLNWIARFRGKNPNAVLIELHTTPDIHFARGLGVAQRPAFEELGIDFGLSAQEQRNFRQLRKWKATFSPSEVQGYTAHIELIKRSNGWYYAEVPAKYRKADKRLTRILEGKKPVSQRLTSRFTEQADLAATKAANYLDQIIIRKLAHLIDATVNTELKSTRRPRMPPHESKQETKKPTRRGKRK